MQALLTVALVLATWLVVTDFVERVEHSARKDDEDEL
jgi:hypothetical protein